MSVTTSDHSVIGSLQDAIDDLKIAIEFIDDAVNVDDVKVREPTEDELAVKEKLKQYIDELYNIGGLDNF